MLGTLGRYLRFMGYDTLSANRLTPGNSREDSILLEIASTEERYLLTMDRELAKRGGKRAIFISSAEVLPQLQELVDLGLVEPRLRMTRCSLCNEKLRHAREKEITGADYAPEQRAGHNFFWCVRCRRLYWTGSHTKDLENRLKTGIRRSLPSGRRLS